MLIEHVLVESYCTWQGKPFCAPVVCCLYERKLQKNISEAIELQVFLEGMRRFESNFFAALFTVWLHKSMCFLCPWDNRNDTNHQLPIFWNLQSFRQQIAFGKYTGDVIFKAYTSH